MTIDHVVRTVDHLRQLYAPPGEIPRTKERPAIDAATQQFIERSPFVLVATHGVDGAADVSPRGGPSGFVQVLSPTKLAIADLPGNNRLDSLENIVATGQVGLLFIIPGKGETVRLNGAAHISTDPEVLGRFTTSRPPRTAIVVDVVTTYIQCAKALHRSRLWQPESWDDYVNAPDGADILTCQQVVPVDAAAVRTLLDHSYEAAALDEARG